MMVRFVKVRGRVEVVSAEWDSEVMDDVGAFRKQRDSDEIEIVIWEVAGWMHLAGRKSPLN